jgi:AcrR family transcriptional regulator
MPATKSDSIFKSTDRPSREKGRETREMLRHAAITLFAKHGYQNVSLRMLAQHIGIQAGSIYNHITNKQEFLFLLLRSIMDDLQAEVQAAVDRAQSPPERLDAFIRTHVHFHAINKEAVFIGNMELRNLEPEHLNEILDMRRAYEGRFSDAMLDAARHHGVGIEDVRFMTRAAFSMMNGVASWYSRKGPMKSDAIAQGFVDLIHRMAGIPQES